MRIVKIISQRRRDGHAIFECGHCDHRQPGYFYDDKYFHENVIPTMECPKCHKSLDPEYRPLTTKYPEGFQI